MKVDLKGGTFDKSGKKLSDLDPKQLEMGQKVEMEHTDNPEIAKKIARDHVAEFGNYYTELKKAEDKMKKEAMVEEAFLDELSKIAKLIDVDKVEDTLGVYLDDIRERKARQLIDQAYDKSFSLRHPFLTGIPTLGLAPLIAAGNAHDAIRRGLLRNDPELRERVGQVEETSHRRNVEMDEANRFSHISGAAGSLAAAYLAAKALERD